jgi:hypothetical protein
MDFVTIEENDQKIRIASKGEDLLVTLEEGRRYGGAAEIRVPLSVVEALLGETEDGRLDIAAALKALGEEKGGRLVEVRDGEDHIEVWVDALADSDRGDAKRH